MEKINDSTALYEKSIRRIRGYAAKSGGAEKFFPIFIQLLRNHKHSATQNGENTQNGEKFFIF